MKNSNYQIILIEVEKNKINKLFVVLYSLFEIIFKIFLIQYEEGLLYI